MYLYIYIYIYAYLTTVWSTSFHTQDSSPDNSFVFIPELPAEIKYPPSIQHHPSHHKCTSHYLQIAHTLGGSKQRSKTSAETLFKKRAPTRSSSNPYVESLHSKLSSKSHSKTVEDMDSATPSSKPDTVKQSNPHVESLHSKLSARAKPQEPIVWLKNIAPKPPPTSGTKVIRVGMKDTQGRRSRYHNEYVEGIHSKLAGRRGCGQKHGDRKRKLIKVCTH